MGTLDILGMFGNKPVKKTLQVTRDKLENDNINHLEQNGVLMKL